MKLPLRLNPSPTYTGRGEVLDAEHRMLCETLKESDAAFIVAAVNSHDAMKDSLMRLIHRTNYLYARLPSSEAGGYTSLVQQDVDDAKTALAAASPSEQPPE